MKGIIVNQQCEMLGCPRPVTHTDLINLCDEHYAEWELHDAEYQADTAARHLERIRLSRASRPKLKTSSEMTERIK